MTVLLHRPILAVGGNLTGAMPSFRGPFSDKMLHDIADQLASSKLGGIGMFCEADDCNPRSVLGPQGKDFWWVHQAGHNLDGLLIIGTVNRTSHGHAIWHPGAPQSRVNDPRPILTVPVTVDGHTKFRSWQRTFSVKHSPKPIGGLSAAHTMDSRMRELDPDLYFADENRPQRVVEAAYPGREVKGTEVVFMSGNPKRIKLGKLESWDVVKETEQDDHPGEKIKVWPRGK